MSEFGQALPSSYGRGMNKRKKATKEDLAEALEKDFGGSLD